MSIEQDDSNRCYFTFADGRRCKLPQFPDDMGLCYVHAKKSHEHRIAQEAANHITSLLNTDILTASDLSSAFATLFSAGAHGLIKPRAVASLAYLGQLMLQTQRLAKQEFLETYTGGWPKVVHESPNFSPAVSDAADPLDPTNTTLATGDSDSSQDIPAENPPEDSSTTEPRTKIM
jgi:hypothetical protein